MRDRKNPSLPDENIQVRSTTTTYAPVEAISQMFFEEDTQDMKQYSYTPDADPTAGSAQPALSQTLSPDARYSAPQGEQPDQNFSKPILQHKFTKLRHLQKLAAIMAIVSAIVAIANNSVQFWQNWHAPINSTPLPSLHDIK